jgi:hypothetical protein
MQRRVVAGFAFAPLACPVAYVFLTVVIHDPQIVLTAGAWWWLLVVCINGLPIAYITELVLGFPAWMVFRHFGVRSLAAYAGGGALIGWLLDLTVIALAGGRVATLFNPIATEWWIVVFPFAASASACAILFRVIVFSGRAPITQG